MATDERALWRKYHKAAEELRLDCEMYGGSNFGKYNAALLDAEQELIKVGELPMFEDEDEEG